MLPARAGKSVCDQVPAVRLPGMAVAVCPLISLMKGQGDALVECGAAADCLNSNLTEARRDDDAPDENLNALAGDAGHGDVRVASACLENTLSGPFRRLLTDLGTCRPNACRLAVCSGSAARGSKGFGKGEVRR